MKKKCWKWLGQCVTTLSWALDGKWKSWVPYDNMVQDYRKGRDQSLDCGCGIKQELLREIGQIGGEVWRPAKELNLKYIFQYVTFQYYYYYFNFDLFTILS